MSSLKTEESTNSANLYLFHHIFLPPKLPPGDDDHDGHELFLLDSLLEALKDFKEYLTGDEAAVFSSVLTMIRRLRDTRDASGNMSEAKLKEALVQLGSTGKWT